jgi:hypothetical protein
MGVIGPGVLLTGGISISTALGHFSFLVHEDATTFSHQLKQGIHISFQLGVAICGVAVMRHPTSSASKALQAVADYANFKSGSLLRSCILHLHQVVKEALCVCDGGQI